MLPDSKEGPRLTGLYWQDNLMNPFNREMQMTTKTILIGASLASQWQSLDWIATFNFNDALIFFFIFFSFLVESYSLKLFRKSGPVFGGQYTLKPNAETLNGIARALGCTIEELLEKEMPQEKVLPEQNPETIDTPYEHPKLLRETVNFVMTFLDHNDHDLALEQVLNCIKLIYQGSLNSNPPRINEQDAAFWMILATDRRKGA